jgi:predicted GH43/DUF377 family glycosyl hydrolase
MPIYRSPDNPIITPQAVRPSRPDFEVIGAFNAGVARLGDEVILLLRVAERPLNPDPGVFLAPIYDADRKQVVVKRFTRDNPELDFSDPRAIQTAHGVYLTSLSHLRLARSRDGVHFAVDETPALFPETCYEAYGIEDPRITLIGDTYYVNYSAVSEFGIVVSLASTRDFRSFRRLGAIFPPDNKDVAIFPEKIGGRYYALHRPSSSGFGRPEIWLAESPDLLCWGNHRHLMGLREIAWDDRRIGGGAVPFRVTEGWLEIYHGADHLNRYCLGAVLLNADEPWKIIARGERPILEPEAPYEASGFFGGVVFTCGALAEDDLVKIYYGAADTSIAYAEIPLEDILKGLRNDGS